MLTQTITLTEEELVLALQQNSKEAYEYLYDNYSKALYGVIYRIVSNENISAGILQSSYMKIWKNMQE